VAYKELKKCLQQSKEDNSQLNNLAADYNISTKSYLKNTVSMMQHSKQNMNKELLKYSIETRQRGTG
jgi:hypothetical protein